MFHGGIDQANRAVIEARVLRLSGPVARGPWPQGASDATLTLDRLSPPKERKKRKKNLRVYATYDPVDLASCSFWR